MPHPTIRILAFSPARVNAGDCVLPVTSSPPAAALGGSLALMRSLAESILAVTGQPGPEPVERATVRRPGSGLHRRISDATLEKYERIAARVAAGQATWKSAALDEAVNVDSLYHWNFVRRAKARAAAARNGAHQEIVA